MMLSIVPSFIFGEKLDFKFEVEDLEKFEQQVFIEITSFKNSPQEEDRKIFPEFLAVAGDQRSLQIPNKHNSLLISLIAKKDGNVVKTKEYSFSIESFTPRPSINSINLSFCSESIPVNSKTFTEFKRFLESILTNEETAPLADDNTVNLDNKIALGALLFINNANKKVLRYDFDLEDTEIVSTDMDVTNFLQEEVIDLRNSSGISASGNFPGIYASLDVALQNSTLIEYKLIAENYKRQSISNFQVMVYELLNDHSNEFVKNIYQELNSVANDGDLLNYELHFVSSIYKMDKIRLENRSYKSTELLASIDLEAQELLSVGGGTSVYSGRSFTTAIEKNNYYLKYEITDFTGKLINNLRRFQEDISDEEIETKIQFYDNLRSNYLTQFNNLFKTWVDVRYYPNGDQRVVLFPPSSAYVLRANAVRNLKKLNSKLIPVEHGEYNFEMERYNLENTYNEDLKRLGDKLAYLDNLLITYRGLQDNLNVDDINVALVTFKGDNSIVEKNVQTGE